MATYPLRVFALPGTANEPLKSFSKNLLTRELNLSCMVLDEHMTGTGFESPVDALREQSFLGSKEDDQRQKEACSKQTIIERLYVESR